MEADDAALPILELESVDAAHAVSMADDYFEFASWTSEEDAQDLVNRDLTPAPQQEQGESSYWNEAGETGIFMETTAACFASADQAAQGWTARTEEQSTIQVVLNIKDHGGLFQDGMGCDHSAIHAVLRQMQIPLLALDGIPEALETQQAQISLSSEIPLFPNDSMAEGHGGDHGSGDFQLFPVYDQPTLVSGVMREESSTMSYALNLTKDGILYEDVDMQARPGVEITEIHEEEGNYREQDLAEELDGERTWTDTRSSAVPGYHGTEKKLQSPRLDRFVELSLLSKDNYTMLDQSTPLLPESVVDSCSLSVNNSPSCCDTATEFHSAYKPVEQQQDHEPKKKRSSTKFASSKRARDEFDRESEMAPPLSPPIASPKRRRRRRTGYERKRPVAKLPARAKEILAMWLDANRENPYPSAEEKTDLVIQTGLQTKQIESWMSNARAKHQIQKYSKVLSRSMAHS